MQRLPRRAASRASSPRRSAVATPSAEKPSACPTTIAAVLMRIAAALGLAAREVGSLGNGGADVAVRHARTGSDRRRERGPVAARTVDAVARRAEVHQIGVDREQRVGVEPDALDHAGAERGEHRVGAPRTRSWTTSRPASVWMSSATLSLPCSTFTAPTSGNGMMWRIGSPSSCSTLMTRAPRSVSSVAPYGAA